MSSLNEHICPELTPAEAQTCRWGHLAKRTRGGLDGPQPTCFQPWALGHALV